MTLLSLTGVGKRYGAVEALDRVTLSVKPGGRTAIVGPSGSGKTTLLRLIAGFEAPDEGVILFDGRELCGEGATVPAHRRGIGIVMQDGALFPHLTVADNIGFGLTERGPARESRIAALAAAVELDGDIVRRRPHELSGGQQQRVALARALARQPKLMLLDEPFSALDAALRESVRAAVGTALDAAGTTAVLVTHDQAEAMSFADQVIILRGGRLVQAGTPRDLYYAPSDRETATFLGDAILLEADLNGEAARCALGFVRHSGSKREGRAQIMLRPEQIKLRPADFDPHGSKDTAYGEVTAVRFAGALSQVTVRLSGESNASLAPITVRVADSLAPPVGLRVSLIIDGRVHVFGK